MLPATLNAHVRRLHLSARRAVEDWLGGAYHSVFKGVGIAFEEVREYQPGDDVRAIDWNVTARTGTPFIKRFVEERELTVMIAVDLGPGMAFGSGARTKLQIAAETSALIAFAALKNNDRVGLLLFSDGVQKLVPPRKGTRHALRLLSELLRVADGLPLSGSLRRTSAAGLGSGLSTLSRVLHRRALVFLASDFATLEDATAVRLLACRHDFIAMFTHDAWERELPDVGLLALRDAQTAEPIVLNTHDAALRKTYQDRMTARVQDLHRTLRRAGADWMELSTAGDHLESLRQFFQKRERRP